MATECNNQGYYQKIKGIKRKAAERLASPEFDGNISGLCREFKISRSTLYRWYDDSDFMGYINWLIEKYTDSELCNAWKALVRKANTGNVEALKLFFEMKGKYRQEITLNKGVVFISGEDEIPE